MAHSVTPASDTPIYDRMVADMFDPTTVEWPLDRDPLFDRPTRRSR